ncbi:MAG: ABC transporter permease [Burkholderiales bacterium]
MKKLNPFLWLSEKNILAIPPLAYLIALFLVPTLVMVVIAFREPGSYGGVAPLIEQAYNSSKINLTWNNFRFALSNHFIWQLFLRSVGYSLLSTFCCLLIGYPLAMLIARSHKKARDILLLLVIIPFWSSFLIRVYAWMIILGPQSGLNHMINYLMQALGLAPVNLLYSSAAVIICMIYINLPFMVLPLYANLEKHDEALLEASRDLGASKFQTFWKITIPLSMPGILAGSALVFIPCIGMFVVPELVGNNCSLMIGNLIKQQFLQTMNWPLGSVTSIIMTVSVLAISVVVGFLAMRIGGLKYANK